jgi:drug/metabolite transporter (DMT)-like permease
LALAVVLFSAIGNLLLAWGMKHLPGAMGIDPLDYVRAMLSPVVALGITLLTLWMLTRMTLMSWADLSVVLPITSVGYIAAAVLGRLCLNEVITVRGWVGIAFIFVGSLVVGTTVQHHSPPPASDTESEPEFEV